MQSILGSLYLNMFITFDVSPTHELYIIAMLENVQLRFYKTYQLVESSS